MIIYLSANTKQRNVQSFIIVRPTDELFHRLASTYPFTLPRIPLSAPTFTSVTAQLGPRASRWRPICLSYLVENFFHINVPSPNSEKTRTCI